MGHGEDGAVVLGDAPAAVGQALGLGQVAVLVEDGGQRGDLLVEGQVRRARQRAGDAPPPALLEELVDLGRVRAAEVAQQLGREVAVALRVEGLGGRPSARRRAGAVLGPRPRAPRRDASRSPSSSSRASCMRTAAGVRESAPATAAASSGPWRFKRLRMARRVVGSCCSGDSGVAPEVARPGSVVTAGSDGRRRTRATGSPRPARQRRTPPAGGAPRWPRAWRGARPPARASR